MALDPRDRGQNVGVVGRAPQRDGKLGHGLVRVDGRP